MDPTLWLILVTAIVALDVALWLCGLFLNVTPDTRFRLLALAVIFLFVALGLLWNWIASAVLCALGLWIFSILAGPSVAEETAPAPAHGHGH